jgi:HK97 family phage major capsid protein
MLDEVTRKAGLPETRINPTRLNNEQRAKADAWQLAVKVVSERRDVNESEGNILARIGSYNSLGGTFVPTEFLSDVYAAQATHDALFDEDAVTYYESSTGRVAQVPLYGDIEAEAVQIDEAADSTSVETNINVPGQANVGVYSFRSPLWRLPMEALQDVEAMGGAMEIFKKFAADRIARGVGKKLINGNGVGTILGLIPALAALGVTPTTAVGSANNTGGSETGANSIGSQDIAKLYYSVNEAYRNSDKAAWFMNDSTRTYLAQLVSKQGVPLVWWSGPEAYIYGRPVKICPGMNNIGASNSPVVFGDGSYWMTRCVRDDLNYVQLVKEAPGLIEKGLVGFRMFARYGGALLYNDKNSPAPFGVLQNHS